MKNIDTLCGLVCLVAAIITADPQWVIAAAIFKIAANVKEKTRDA